MLVVDVERDPRPYVPALSALREDVVQLVCPGLGALPLLAVKRLWR